ncbi:MAG: protein kinase [Myxococcales bacterium]|nr:protein kinase [Myxococcales bacterium]
MFRAGETLDDRYRIVRELGAGGYGTVYVAEELDRDDLLGAPVEGAVLRRVALKVLDRDPAEPKRFGAEVRALCRLAHPCIVTVFGWGVATPDGSARPRPYIAMELVDGAPLSDLAGPPARAAYAKTLGALINVADALAHAHERQVIHRDLKPQNILLGDDGLPRIVDFGLSWLVQPDSDASQRVGTPGYLAPELLSGLPETRDHRADIYSLGATVFALFAGRSPFSADGVLATVRRQLDGADVEFPADFPAPLQRLVSRCLERDPINRPRSAAVVAEELRRVALAPGILLADGAALGSLDDAVADGRVDVRDATLRGLLRFDHPTRGAGVKFQLVTGAGAEAHADGAFAYAERPTSLARRVFDSLTWAWEGAEVNLFGARVIEASGGRRFLAADGASVPVLAPYHPVTVTDVAKAEGVAADACATRVLVDLRRARTPSREMIVGSLAHEMLERMIEDPDRAPSFDSTFEQCFPGFRLQALSAGMRDADVPRVRDDLREHFVHLARWTRADSETRRGRVAEARRISSRYGLEGRIDLSVADDHSVRIVELKTGRTEVAEHERQLRCYTLMWDGIAEAQHRRVDGFLLYSKTGRQKPLVRREHAREREVVVARNHVVAMRRWFSDGDTTFRPPEFGEHPERCNDYPCKFRRDECRTQCATLGSASGEGALDAPALAAHWGTASPELVRAARAYYLHFVRLIEREFRAVSESMGEVYRHATLQDRVERRRALLGAEVSRIDETARVVHLRCRPVGVFDVGDRVVLHRGDFDAEPALFGVVATRSADELAVACAGTDFAQSLPTDGWIVDEDVLRVGFSTMHRALYALVAGGDLPRLQQIVTPHRVAATRAPADCAAPDLPCPHLNDDQRRAVAAALRDEPALLVQGPPGTGKTTVIAEIVRALVERGARVLVAACTHTAVDNALERIVRAGVARVLRVGTMRDAPRTLVAALTDAGLAPANHFVDEVGATTPTLEALATRIDDARVFAATTNACGSHATFDALRRAHSNSGPPFDVVVVDEASQLTEPMTLAAVLLGVRFVLVGDEMQLPPVVTARDAASAAVGAPAPLLADAGLSGLDRSLFARLMPFAPHVMLRTQYRMNSGVQRLPNLAFYAGKLVAADGRCDAKLPLDIAALDGLDAELRRRLDPARPSVWVATAAPGEQRTHDGEAREVARTTAALANALQAAGGLRDDAIGVISPFRAQCHAIRGHLATLVSPDLAARIEVDTVERFQGREKDAILISLVSVRWSDFVMNERRLNVALTRARFKTIVFGSPEVGRRLVDSVPSGPVDAHVA